MNPRVKRVKALPLARLSVEFTDEQSRVFDVTPYFAYPVFRPLMDDELFRQVAVDHGTVSWPGGIDLDPDSVYLESVPQESAHLASQSVTAQG